MSLSIFAFFSPTAEVFAAGQIYYVSNTGNDSNPGTLSSPWRTIQKSASTAEAGDTVYVRGGTYREEVSVSNSGTSSDYITFAAYPGEMPIIDGAGVTIGGAALFSIYEKDYITVDGFHFANSPKTGLYVSANSDYINILNNDFKSAFEGSPIAVGGYGPCDHILVENNEIDRTVPANCSSANGCWASMIGIGGTNHAIVRNNHIYRNTVGEGIIIGNGSDNGQVYGNIIENVPQPAIYVDARGLISNIDIFANIIRQADTTSWTYGILLANEESYAPDVPTELGSRIQDVDIYNNIIYDTSEGIVVGEWGEAIGSIDNVKIINNTLYNVTYNGVHGSNLANLTVTNVVVRNNIFRNCQLSRFDNGITTIDHNLFDDTCIGSNCVLGDPVFTSIPLRDFRLQGISPAINAGSSVGAFVTDFAGAARPSGVGYDLGAFEYSLVSAYQLTVNSGTGSGSYPQQRTVSITADAASAGKAFDRWAGDAQYVTDANSASTTIVMPAANIAVTATYEDATTDQVLTSITVSPSAVSLAKGSSQQLSAQASDQSGASMNSVIAWSSSDASVARVDAYGQVTALAEGVAVITVRSGNIVAQSSVTVTPDNTSGGAGGGSVLPSIVKTEIISVYGNSVILHLDVINATEMMLSDLSSFAGSSWEAYSQTKTYAKKEGQMGLYLKFRSSTGNFSPAIKLSIPGEITSPYPVGTLIKAPDSFKVYVIIEGKKKWISTPEVFEQLGYRWTNIQDVTKAQLDAITDYEDNLIRAIGGYKVYLVVGGVRRHIPNPQIFIDYGFAWTDVKDVPAETIAKYQDTYLIKQSGDAGIYYLTGNVRKLIPTTEIFDSYSDSYDDIQVISKTEMDGYALSNLIRLAGGNDVYLVQGNIKRRISSPQVFSKYDLDWNLVLAVNRTEFDWYQNGEELK